MNLAFAFTFSKASVEEPGCIDQERLFTEAAGVKVSWWVDGIVRISFETHSGPEERGVYI